MKSELFVGEKIKVEIIDAVKVKISIKHLSWLV